MRRRRMVQAMSPFGKRVGSVAWAVLTLAGATHAQELEPRAYRVLPVGVSFVVGSYQFSSGNVLFDATAPVEDLEIDVHVASLSYMRTIGLAGRSASISVAVPRVYARGSGRLGGELVERDRSGWADARARLVVNLLGGPAMSMHEFATFEQRRTLGVGLTISGPTGQYDSDNVVNFGANRWGLKPEVGYSMERGPWILDTALGVWLFTRNDDGPGGATVTQDPIWSWQGHVSYGFANGMWIALDLNYFYGGEISVGGKSSAGLQANSRAGWTLSIPIARRHSLKLAAATGAYTRAGADFDIATIAYQYRWGS